MLNFAVETGQKLWIIRKFIKETLVKVEEELEFWRRCARNIPQKELQKQALASLRAKKFHAQGGAVFALLGDRYKKELYSFIVAFQTISDYLDNLCDRSGCMDEKAFEQLHLSLLHALQPEKNMLNYYKFYPYKNDGGYLNKLVLRCRQEVLKFPSYAKVKKNLIEMAEYYKDLQVKKHVEPAKREHLIRRWAEPQLLKHPGVLWNEFAAATGSTLGIFCLLAASTRKELTADEINKYLSAYFPWICALHIQLDYLIDLEEDRAESDFNFVNYYKNEEQTIGRMSFLYRKSYNLADKLPESTFHKTIVQGLLAMYLSDPKTKLQAVAPTAYKLLSESGRFTCFACNLVSKLRIQGKI